MKDGDITDQRPDRRNNDIAEMREWGWGRGKREEEQRTEYKKAEGEGCDGERHSFISFFYKRLVDTFNAELYSYFYNKS